LEKESPLHYSNVLLLCPKCNRGVRIARKKSGDKIVRECKRCGEGI
jgi:large subunit ribosomal protein L24